MNAQLNRFQTTARNTALWATVGLGFTLPIATAPASLMFVAILLGWIASGNWAQKWASLRGNCAGAATLLLIGLMLLGTSYGEGTTADKLHYLTKYDALLLIPVLLSLNLNEGEKWRALDAFCAAMLITLTLSMLIWLKVLPVDWFKNSATDNPIVFKLHITHGFFMALAAFILYQKSTLANRRKRLLMLGLAGLAVINALLMVKGRTGQVVLFVLLVYLFHLRFPRYGIFAGIISVFVLAFAAYHLSPAFKERADVAVTEATHWQARKGGNESSSIGTRFDYYSTTVAIIKEHPFIGVGTGGFESAYLRQIAGTALESSNNPHNQYLLLTAQLGLIGLTGLLVVYAACLATARRFPAPLKHLAIGMVLAYIVGNLFNSFMLDFSERLFFAWIIGVLLSLPPRPSHS